MIELIKQLGLVYLIIIPIILFVYYILRNINKK